MMISGGPYARAGDSGTQYATERANLPVRSHGVVAPVLLAVKVDDQIVPNAGLKLARGHALLDSSR